MLNLVQTAGMTSDMEDPALLMAEDVERQDRHLDATVDALTARLDLELDRAARDTRGDVIECRNQMRTVALAWIRVALNDPIKEYDYLAASIRTILARLDAALKDHPKR
jgi:hypothetical protein